jgi:Protein O-mannosyl-transferase TMEM260-like
VTAVRPADDRLWLAAVVVVVTALYAWKLMPGIAPHGDISKFQFAGPVGGTVHQTGYPLYLIITWLAAHSMPVSMATAATAMSAVAMTAAAALAFVALRELDVRRPIAVVFVVVMGVAPFVFYYAIVAEVYAMNLLLVAALLVFLLRWRRTASDVDLGVAIAVMALSFAHHMTTVFLVPGILVFVWMVDRQTFRRGRVWAFGALALLASASLYGYLIWRAHDPSTPFLEVAPDSWRDLPAIWLGTGASGSINLDPITMLGERLPTLARSVIRSSLLALPLAILGLRSRWRDPAVAMLTLWAAGSLVFALVFRFPDVAGFLIPVVFVIVLLAGVGAEWIAVRYSPSALVGIVALAVLALVALVTGVGFVGVQSHDDYESRTREWLAEVPENAVLAASYTDAMAAFYAALVDGERTDVTTISDYPLSDPQGSVLGRYLAGEVVVVPHSRELLEPGRSVYAPGRRWACQLTGAGFVVEPFTEQLVRVVALADPGSAAVASARAQLSCGSA